ncbi:collagen alpha-1(I) chain-like [Aquila chrysaetos chrysaetos]|uniref:collagen alpha-1(I) chain-like n=1 Tax=Aquila chrysaetos chrysaetos TaxID=223781 RepID=UPI001B7D44EC|nr:collagen alpha-1(I) chain-like [Aquila chrysaetos chrysaetos]
MVGAIQLLAVTLTVRINVGACPAHWVRRGCAGLFALRGPYRITSDSGVSPHAQQKPPQQWVTTPPDLLSVPGTARGGHAGPDTRCGANGCRGGLSPAAAPQPAGAPSARSENKGEGKRCHRAAPSEAGSPARRPVAPGGQGEPLRPPRQAPERGPPGQAAEQPPPRGPSGGGARLESGGMAARSQGSLRRLLQSSQEAQHRQAVLVRKLQAKVLHHDTVTPGRSHELLSYPSEWSGKRWMLTAVKGRQEFD